MFKIIIIEDDKEIREELKILLQNSGYEVKAISEFENVENKIIEEQAHLVLLDINLPGKSGFEICSKVRSKSKIPIIFVTSRNNSMDELNGIMLGGIAFIIGIALGTFLYQIFTSIIMNLFNQTYKIEIYFSLKAIGITAIYFFGIFALVLLNCRRKIKKIYCKQIPKQ